MSKLTPYDISYIIKKFRLKTVEDFKELGFTLKKCGEGASRVVYAIRGYNLVVKIPVNDPSYRRHALQEYKAYKKISDKKIKKYGPLRKYLPNIHCCTKDGVILMDRYKPCGYKRYRKEIQKIKRYADFLFPDNGDTDMYGDNLGRTNLGKLVILDFGCFYAW